MINVVVDVLVISGPATALVFADHLFVGRAHLIVLLNPDMHRLFVAKQLLTTSLSMIRPTQVMALWHGSLRLV